MCKIHWFDISICSVAQSEIQTATKSISAGWNTNINRLLVQAINQHKRLSLKMLVHDHMECIYYWLECYILMDIALYVKGSF